MVVRVRAMNTSKDVKAQKIHLVTPRLAYGKK